MSLTLGLKFKKFDLHIHTPASEDYKDKQISPDDVVNAALNKGLSAIAITDHQTADWIDKLKATATGKPLVIFPGAEVLVTGGKSGVHLLIIFDTDKNSEYIRQFLNKIGVFQKNGKPTIASELTVGQVADELEKFDPTAIMILAHCHSSKGVTGDIAGETRKLIFDKERRCLLGAEANESDFVDENKKKQHTRVIDCFDGTDPNYHNRKLGIIQSSDAHHPNEIGSAYTYFKVDEPIRIEDLRQCLIDRETRIRQSFEYKQIVYPHINKLQITSGFLADQEIIFHEGLNSILGAKGSGKSLAIEFLRFGLNQEPTDDELFKDHLMKLEKCLKLHGQLIVEFTDESGHRYQITRTYNPAEDNPVEIKDLSDSSRKDFGIEQIFPVLFLSQNEIIKVAEDKTGAEQRRFIDKFFDFHKYQENIEKLKTDLSEIDHKFVDCLKAHLHANQLLSRVATIKEEVDKINRQLTNEIFSKFEKKEKVGRAIKVNIDFIDSLKESVSADLTEYNDLVAPDVDPEDADLAKEPAVKRASGISSQTIDSIKTGFTKTLQDIEAKQKLLLHEYTDWEIGFKSIKSEYEKIVKESGGNSIVLDQKRKALMTELANLEKELARLRGRAAQIKTVAEKRDEIIESMDNAYRAYFDERKKRCEFFTTNSGGALSVSIKEREDTSGFRDNLIRLKRGSWLKDEEIEKITASISPKDFIDAIMRYEWTGRSKKEALELISSKTGIKCEQIERLVQHLFDEYEHKDILSLLYSSVPKDVPVICYKVGSVFKKIDELSVGQKAAALLIISLSDGIFPVAIDQPEDSLDLRSIWEDVCEKLRGSKDRRQFIFTTHNSSVAVASDTDKFTILHSDANRSKVVYSGSINNKDIKQEVIDYLEGGPDTYNKKRQKYNI